jgi:hypothetical protein
VGRGNLEHHNFASEWQPSRFLVPGTADLPASQCVGQLVHQTPVVGIHACLIFPLCLVGLLPSITLATADVVVLGSALAEQLHDL